ncbi:MAG: hypothetical protein ACW99A_07020 [Candidatus Kariarchaeaceae archaeon]|jgi:L-amino acid N-acyltransferase YncA
MKDYFTIVEMEKMHIPSVVNIHLEAFRDYFLTYLGKSFLKLFYSGILNDERSIKLIALDKTNDVLGFGVGAVDPSGFYRRLLKHDWMKFSIVSIWAVIRKPIIIKRLIRAKKYPAMYPEGVDVALFMQLGISLSKNIKALNAFKKENKDWKNIIGNKKNVGVGKAIAESFLSESRSRGVKKVILNTDKDNISVNKLHESLGGIKTGEFTTPEGRQMYEYTVDLEVNAP